MSPTIKKITYWSLGTFFFYGITVLAGAQSIVKTSSEATGKIGDPVTYVMSITNNSVVPTPCPIETFEEDAAGGVFPAGWTNPPGQSTCNATFGVENVGAPHNNVFEITSNTNPYYSCFATYNCPGQVTDGSVCADVYIAAGEAELLWRQSGASDYQIALDPGLLTDGVNNMEIRVVTNASPVVLSGMNLPGLSFNTWYNICMSVSNFSITMTISGASIATTSFSGTDTNQSFPSGNVGVQTSGVAGVPGSADFDNVNVVLSATNFLNTTVTDTLPVNMSYVSCSGAACSNSGGVVNWNTGEVDPGNSENVTMIANVTGSCPESIANQASWDIGLPQMKVDSIPVTDVIDCTATNTPTNTSTNTVTNSPTNTASSTATNTATETATATATNTFTNTSTNSATCTPTNTPSTTTTNTATNTATETVTNTVTNTSTNTASNTPTNTLTNTPTFTFVNTATNTSTNTPSQTSTATATNTATNTFTNTATQTATETSTNTATNTATNTSTKTTTVTPTNTPTSTSTNTSTNTPTLVFTVTSTFTPTLTPTSTTTSTPTCVTHIWPDPYNPKKAFDGSLRISCMGNGTVVTIYTVSGELVQTLNNENAACIVPNTLGTTYCWNGRNGAGTLVATGIYLYAVQEDNQVTQRGKFLVVNGF